MNYTEVNKILTTWQDRLDNQMGKRGNGIARLRLKAARDKYLTYGYNTQTYKPKAYAALGLAKMANIKFDEHGHTRGDYEQSCALDFVPKEQAKQKPYLDMGNAGLGLVAVTRTRQYAKSYSYGPSTSTSYYIVGRNEIGTFFAHPVPMTAHTVLEAIQWLWNGHANDIIARQGDVAVIRGLGPKMPNSLPQGHQILNTGVIIHATHPNINIPGIGERLIVARRAFDKRAHQTKD